MKSYFFNHNKTLSIAHIWISGGSNLDHKNKKGINQILCNLMTRGCKNYNKFAFSDYINSYGAELNCESIEDGIIISVKSLREYFKKVYPILEIMLNEPSLLKEEFINSKTAILNLINKSKENPFNITFEKWRKLVYQEHPYAFDTFGYEKDNKNINYIDVLNEFKSFEKRTKFQISNHKIRGMVDIDALNLSPQKVFSLSSAYAISTKKENRFTKTTIKVNQIIFMLGNKTCSIKDCDYFKLKVLESHLSFGMSSILFKNFREKNGLSYDIGSYYPFRLQESPFLIYLSVSKENALLALKLLLEILEKLKNFRISKEELELAKIKLKSQILKSNQNIEDVTFRKIQLISIDQPHNFEVRSFKAIDSITSDEVLKICNKYFSNPYLSVSGDKSICRIIEEYWMNK